MGHARMKQDKCRKSPLEFERYEGLLRLLFMSDFAASVEPQLEFVPTQCQNNQSNPSKSHSIEWEKCRKHCFILSENKAKGKSLAFFENMQWVVSGTVLTFPRAFTSCEPENGNNGKSRGPRCFPGASTTSRHQT